MSGYVSSILRRLEKQQAKEAALEYDDIWYQFQVAPSCPPDKRLHIRGGIALPGFQWGAIMNTGVTPDHICDFENENDTQLPLSFANAGYYLPLILCYFGDWLAYGIYEEFAEPVFDNVVGTEIETTTEAEAQIDAFLNGYTQWYNYRLPLYGVVLRNDGNAGVNYAILPIDLVNRGRSYLYRDARVKRGILP